MKVMKACQWCLAGVDNPQDAAAEPKPWEGEGATLQAEIDGSDGYRQKQDLGYGYTDNDSSPEQATPTMLTKEERAAKLKAAMAKLSPIKSRQQFMENAKKVLNSCLALQSHSLKLLAGALL